MLPYTTYSDFLSRLFPGEKIQKISLNAGFSCPNRDGTIGHGGCIYCDNSSFTPAYCLTDAPLMKQLEAGKEFFGRKYPDMRFLGYFQSFTSTFTNDTDRLAALYDQVAETDRMAGIIIGTRPDTLPEPVVAVLERLARKTTVVVELGAETSFDATLRRINRGHTWRQTVDAVSILHEAGLHPGIHLIAGLPGETPEMILETTRRASCLPVETVKFHHLQVIRGTELHRQFEAGTADLHYFTPETYLDLCEQIVRIIPRRIAIERFLASAPPEKVISPKWGLKNYQFINLLHNRLAAKPK